MANSAIQNKKMKKSIFTVCAAMIIAALTSCGGGGKSVNSNTPSTSTPTSSPTSSSTPASETTSSGPTSSGPTSSGPTSPSTSTSPESTSVEKVLTSIEMEDYPKTDYMAGDTFEVTGGTIKLNYSDSTNEIIPLTMEMIETVPDLTTPGQKTVNVSHAGQSTSYYIQVSVVKTDPTFTWSFEANHTFIYDGTGTAPDISVVVNEAGVTYETHISKDGSNLGSEVPTIPGTYSLVVETTENDYYNAVHTWRNFKIANKQVPTIGISIENGHSFTYDGTTDAPVITVTVPEGVTYSTYFEENEVSIGTTFPTTPGTYSFIVETEENEAYSAGRAWRWFRVAAPTVKVDPEITFSFEPGYTFIYDGTGEEPVITVGVPEGVQYSTYFEKSEVNIGTAFPTEPGTYSFIVETEENETYLAKRAWRWFRVAAPTAKTDPTVTFSFEPRTQFAYDGTGEAPDISFTVSEGVTYDYHFTDETEANLGKTIPTTPGSYSLVVVTEENETYNALTTWCTFEIVAPTSPASGVSLKKASPR